MQKSLLTILFLSGCATQGIDRADQNQITKEFYASVESIKQVKLSSDVKSGIIGGAVIGTIDELDGNHEDMIAGALGGALVGGLLTAIFEGSTKAYEFTLKSEQEGTFTLVQKELIDTKTGCVKVRVSSKARIQPAPKNSCLELIKNN